MAYRQHFKHLKILGPLLLPLFLYACISSNGLTNNFTVPGAPTVVTATAGISQVTVSWLAPADNGGSSITSYTVTAVQDTSKHCTGTKSDTACVVTGLTNGTTYTFTVTATNAAGTSHTSVATESITPANIPGAPRAVIGETGLAQITVSWLAPAENGGSAITKYTATAMEDTALHCTSASDTFCVVRGLAKRTPYTFSVTATNTIGTSLRSVPSTPVTPTMVAPGAPTNVLGQAGYDQISVSWSPGDYGGPISITVWSDLGVPETRTGTVVYYTVTAIQDNFKHCTTAMSNNCVVTNLSNGTAYNFTVTARNAAGSSSPSELSAPVTPTIVVPSAPTNVKDTAGYSQATVSWSAPLSNGGSSITGYKATSVQDASKYCTSTSATTCVVTGLTAETAYSFTVTATNAVGTSAPSSSSALVLIPSTIPSVSWRPLNSGTTSSLRSVIWTGSQFVAVGQDTHINTFPSTILTSPDGVTWTPRISEAAHQLNSVIWTGSQLVAVGSVGTVLTSTDGVTWTTRPLGIMFNLNEDNLRGVTWTGNQLVAVASLGTILTSPDGVTWTSRTSGTTNNLNSVAWMGSQLVAVGAAGTILTSPDAVTWTPQSSGTKSNLYSVTLMGSQIVVVSEGNSILTSPNGLTWTSRTWGTGSSILYSVTWTGSQLVAVTMGGAILTSPDGVTWTFRNSGTANHLFSVVWTGNQLVTVGNSGTVLTSP